VAREALAGAEAKALKSAARRKKINSPNLTHAAIDIREGQPCSGLPFSCVPTSQARRPDFFTLTDSLSICYDASRLFDRTTRPRLAAEIEKPRKRLRKTVAACEPAPGIEIAV
jgi:hypothetical protein